jgi:uroporphyrinogen decarboxylase
MAALSHQIPDKVPAYVRAVTRWERYAAYFGVTTWPELKDCLGNTILSFIPAYLKEPLTAQETGLPATLWGVPEDFLLTYTDSIPRPLARAQSVQDIDSFAWPSGSKTNWDFQDMRKRLLAETTHARLSPSWMPVFSRLCELFGMEQAMVNMRWNLPLIEAALVRIDDFYTEFYSNMLETCADQIDIFGMGDDFAGNRGLLIDPALWRRLFKPLYAKYFGMAKSRGLKTMMHCCGRILDVLPDLIDVGLDAWQTVQTHLPGQEPELIKARFGMNLTFVGAIDTTNVLSISTPEQVRAHVRRQILALAKGGGYICAPDHTIMEEVPAENVMAMYQEIATFQQAGYTA